MGKRPLVGVDTLRGEQQDLRVEELQHPLQVLLVTDLRNHLDPERVSALGEVGELVLVGVRGQQHRVGARIGSALGRRAESEHGEGMVGRGVPDRATQNQPARTPEPCRVDVPVALDLDEHRDSGTLGDRLTQPSVAHRLGMLLLRSKRANSSTLPPMATEVQRVCLLGAESTGKTTMARALASAYNTVWNPEYGRAYTEVGRERGAAWTSGEFAHIARIQCWYEDVLTGQAREVLFCDTDAYTTAVFHEEYLGSPAAGFTDLVGRDYALYLLCGLDVPFQDDPIREFAATRRRMHERFVRRCEQSGRPWVLLEHDHETRLASARVAVDTLLGR